MRKSRMIAVLSTLVVTACGGAPPDQRADQEPADPREVDSAKQPIINGWAIDENLSGLVKLEVFSSTFNDWFAYCSGTLMTNSLIYTASHCFDDSEIQGRRPNIRMGSQVRRAATVWRNTSVDLALVTLESPMDMWNWTGSAHATNPPQVNNWQYARNLAPSTASVNGQTLLCTGISPGGFGAPMKVGFFKATSSTLEVLVETLAPFNQFHEGGDSGGGCLTNWGLYSAPLGATTIATFGTFAKGPGANQMATLFLAVLLGLPPSIVY